MTAEEVFCDLAEKYGEEFNWHMFQSIYKTNSDLVVVKGK